MGIPHSCGLLADRPGDAEDFYRYVRAVKRFKNRLISVVTGLGSLSCLFWLPKPLLPCLLPCAEVASQWESLHQTG